MIDLTKDELILIQELIIQYHNFRRSQASKSALEKINEELKKCN